MSRIVTDCSPVNYHAQAQQNLAKLLFTCFVVGHVHFVESDFVESGFVESDFVELGFVESDFVESEFVECRFRRMQISSNAEFVELGLANDMKFSK